MCRIRRKCSKNEGCDKPRDPARDEERKEERREVKFQLAGAYMSLTRALVYIGVAMAVAERRPWGKPDSPV